jgi:hypothetical protein
LLQRSGIRLKRFSIIFIGIAIMPMKPVTLLSIFTIILISCQEQSGVSSTAFNTKDLNYANRKLLEVAMEDGFSPPIASRVYVYPHIANHAGLHLFYPDSLTDLSKAIRNFPQLTGLEKKDAHPELTALLSFCKTAQKLVFSEHHMVTLAGYFTEKAKNGGLSSKRIAASGKLADSISKRLIAWMNRDQYIETRTMDRFTSSRYPGDWRETPPDYVAGMESHWMKIRPLLIDSAGIYPCSKPPSYNKDKSSEFYKMVSEVYEHSKKLDSTQREIAWFWDDNPNVSEHRGHLVTMTHKISPPGHWLNIISQVSEKENSSLFKTTKAYTYASIAMFDGIISCWYEKYKCNLVRPVSYIQEYLDVNWTPLIQTPPFPEWTSGHSVLSAAAATVLTDIYGDNYAFSDSTELLFGQPVRSFKSFNEAAWEVSLSRFYAGIHYMNSVTEGNKQGKYIGDIVLNKLRK